MINIKIPSNKNQKSMEEFFIKRNLNEIVKLARQKTRPKQIYRKGDKAYLPTLKDLYRIYQFVLLNKRTTILEFGSGWSSLILSLALKELKDKFHKEVKVLRRNNPFELFVVENQKKYFSSHPPQKKQPHSNFKSKNKKTMYSTKTRFKGQDAFTKTGFLHVGDTYVQKTAGT